ncbi:MAG: hypothetical protein KC486_12725 [Myxococcales bacterium]|nr:hypothetical protein [Myxococcales bacterium]
MASEGIRERLRQRWRSDDGAHELGLLEYAGAGGVDPAAFFAIARVIRPPLIQRDGIFYLAAHFDEYVHAQWTQRLDDPHEVQRVINLVHVSTLFAGRELSRTESLEVAALLAEIWSSVFAEVGLRGEIVGEVSDDIGVTLVDVDADAPPAPTPLVPGFSALDREFAAFQDPAA